MTVGIEFLQLLAFFLVVCTINILIHLIVDTMKGVFFDDIFMMFIWSVLLILFTVGVKLK